MRPVRAAIDAGVLRPLSYLEFKQEFGSILGNSISSLNKYINKEYTGFKKDSLYEMMKQKFIRILEP